ICGAIGADRTNLCCGRNRWLAQDLNEFRHRERLRKLRIRGTSVAHGHARGDPIPMRDPRPTIRSTPDPMPELPLRDLIRSAPLVMAMPLLAFAQTPPTTPQPVPLGVNGQLASWLQVRGELRTRIEGFTGGGFTDN